ncbi:hypothetical protein Cs308_0295 [Candidatus Chlamydia sanziniae]|uniref:Uncharacterized protein n=1 Tax=Candidatus Chlamydia sanziniae TaxID=1806891 RepID=A0A1A9HX16_9CHLA|nr:hypothetical protein Cs308_0295 [Candidatus Chlamydia sanziniae]
MLIKNTLFDYFALTKNNQEKFAINTTLVPQQQTIPLLFFSSLVCYN